jgi:oligoendopeptidase F
MTPPTVPARSALAREMTWNAESVFPTPADWAAELKRLSESLDTVRQFQGRLAQGPSTLLAALDAIEQLMRRVGKVYTYASMSHYVDTTDQNAVRMFGQAGSLYGQAAATVAFLDPELLAIGEPTLAAWMKADARLSVYAQYAHNLFRRQAHVRSAEVEEVLGLAADALGGPYNTFGMLTNADFKFAPAKGTEGAVVELAQGSYDTCLASTDRDIRRTAWENYTQTYLDFRNTLTTNLTNSLKQSALNMRVRRYASTLEASLFENNIPTAVFHNLINTYQKNLPTWHRYWRIRRKALGVETLHPYDIWAPLTPNKPRFTYPQAVEAICAGMAPLGEGYVNILRRGCLEERWVDVPPNQGKTDGAFSSGVPGTHPFILMSFDGDIFNLSTLAHELGHSMHSYFTWQTQPFVYANYSLFVAEVASNFNQAMVRAHLLQTNTDRDFQISVIEEAMNNFHRYFFIMPTLARFELEAHQRVEQGQGLTANDLLNLMADLFSEGYGGEMQVDRERVGITWATFPHMFADYYVYQYATGISGAHALSGRILQGLPGSVEAYVEFLKTGSALYPLDALKRAGVDLTQPAPVEATFNVLAGMVDRLEQLFA